MKDSLHSKKFNHTVILQIPSDCEKLKDCKYYADRYTCNPPPYFIISITFIELGFFIYNFSTINNNQNDSTELAPTDSIFIFRSDKRHEFWRFILYMILHVGWFHLVFNLCVQLLIGLPLEMIHGSTRIGCIYLSGVLAGSLGTSVFDPEAYLVGASGGVYALLAAHLANVMLNYSSMRYGIFRLLAIFIIALCDIGFALYARQYTNSGSFFGPSVSYIAHSTGALAGLTMGLLVLKNFEEKLHKKFLWWIALGIYAACTSFAIAFNIMNYIADRHLEKNHLLYDIEI